MKTGAPVLPFSFGRIGQRDVLRARRANHAGNKLARALVPSDRPHANPERESFRSDQSEKRRSLLRRAEVAF